MQYSARNAQITFVEKLQLKIFSFKNYKHFITHSLKVIRALTFVHAGSLEITLKNI